MFGTLTLGELIALLEKQPQETYVRFDFGGFIPTKIASYRGFYDHLAIGFALSPGHHDCYVSNLLSMLRQANGADFAGYKGGIYHMGLNTPIWVANAGTCTDTGIVGVTGEYETIIQTAYCPT